MECEWRLDWSDGLHWVCLAALGHMWLGDTTPGNLDVILCILIVLIVRGLLHSQPHIWSYLESQIEQLNINL